MEKIFNVSTNQKQELPMTDMFLYRTLQTSFLQFSNFSGNYQNVKSLLADI